MCICTASSRCTKNLPQKPPQKSPKPPPVKPKPLVIQDSSSEKKTPVSVAKNASSGKVEMKTYYIYHKDGLIKRVIPSNIPAANRNKVNYHYIDHNNQSHALGVCTFIEITPTKNIRGGETKNGKVRLVNMNQLRSYSNPKDAMGPKFKFHIPNSPRTYCQLRVFASLLGALLEVCFEDFTLTGFCNATGTAPPSVSHNDGVNGDIRILRKSGKTHTEGGMDLRNDSSAINLFDDRRTRQYINTAVKFGWKAFLFWKVPKLDSSGKPIYVNRVLQRANLPYCTQAVNHHHLHM